MFKQAICHVGRRAGALTVAGLIGLLPGCAAPPKTLEVKGEADAVLNRDGSGNSLSVAVQVYQLKDVEEFSRLTYDMFASGRPDSEPVGTSLLEKSEAILVPGATVSNMITLRDDAKYLGLVAFFRQPDPHYWRFLVDADKVRREGLSFIAKDCYLALKTPKPAAIPGQPLDAPPQCSRAGSTTMAGAVPAASKRSSPGPKPATSSATSSKH